MARKTEPARYRRARPTGRAAALLAAACGLAGWQTGASATTAVPLKVCMAADNAPLSWQSKGQARGLDVRIAQATAQALGRPLVVVPFESEYEKESTLTHEVNALLSAGVCDAASGFPLLAADVGPPSRASARTPDYPGAKRKRERPYITLGTLTAGRAYQAVALGLALPAGAAPVASLSDLGGRKVAVTSGTVGGAMAMGWRQGALRGQLVSMGHREDVLGELSRPAARFDAALVPLSLLDGWRLQHPGSPLVAAAWRRPIGINLGFVTLQAATEVRAALDATVVAARADGRLAAWAAEEGVSWAAPTAPELSNGPGPGDLAAE